MNLNAYEKRDDTRASGRRKFISLFGFQVVVRIERTRIVNDYSTEAGLLRQDYQLISSKGNYLHYMKQRLRARESV